MPKICLYPFSRMELGYGSFVPCCEDWLTARYRKLPKGEDLWNGPQAQELRRRILKGDYSLCKRELCQMPLFEMSEVLQNPLLNSETPLTPANLAAMRDGVTELPDGPISISMVTDPRCNLACPSCRGEHIFTINKRTEARMFTAEAFLEKHRKTVETMKIAGNGEVFFSPWLRSLLKRASPKRFPKLRHITILTNGLLCNAESFESLRPGSDSIRHVSVSIDAGNEETYAVVRGGEWPKLMDNLRWLSSLRKTGRLDWLSINFVARKANFRTLPEFLALGENLGVDSMYISTFTNWKRMTMNYAEQAVHLSDHPDHQEFRSVCEEVVKNKRVRLAIEIPEKVSAHASP